MPMPETKTAILACDAERKFTRHMYAGPKPRTVGGVVQETHLMFECCSETCKKFRVWGAVAPSFLVDQA